jgi:hypothetical protein
MTKRSIPGNKLDQVESSPIQKKSGGSDQAMRFNATLLYCCALLALMLVGPHCYAQESVGVVAASRGEVSVISSGEPRPLRQGDFITVNDEIVAADRSFAVLQFFDGSKVSLRPNSSIIVEQFGYGGGAEGSATIKLLTGGMKLTPGAIASSTPENFRISTPGSLFMVSGTEGSLNLCGDEVCDQKGIVEISD